MSMILAAMLLQASASAAQPSPDCFDPVTQSAMNACAFREYERADAAMNRAWRAARAQARKSDADGFDHDDGEPGSWPTLLAAQRAWIQYRDAHCRLSSYDARGGTMQPLLRSTCMTELTKARTRQLRALLTNQVSGE